MIICSQVVRLGQHLLGRYNNSGILAELEEAISTFRNANEHLPQNHPLKAACLNNLGISVVCRFEHLANPDDLDEAIMVKQQAVHLTPDDHPDKPAYLNNLGKSFLYRFGRLNDLADLDEAITAQQQAVHLTPDGHPDKPTYLNNLEISFHRRLERLGGLLISDQDGADQCKPSGSQQVRDFISPRRGLISKQLCLCHLSVVEHQLAHQPPGALRHLCGQP